MTTSGAISSSERTPGSTGSVDRDWLLTAGGATLLFLALSKRSTIGLAGLLGAGYLLYRSLPTGTLPGLLPDASKLVPDSLRSIAGSAGGSDRDGRDWYTPAGADSVDEASMESFPASDPATKY